MKRKKKQGKKRKRVIPPVSRVNTFYEVTEGQKIFVLGTGRCGLGTFFHACQNNGKFTVSCDWNIGTSLYARRIPAGDHIAVGHCFLPQIAILRQQYPSAKWVHLSRDREACIRSMEVNYAEHLRQYAATWLQFTAPLVDIAAIYYDSSLATCRALLPDAFELPLEQAHCRWDDCCNFMGIAPPPVGQSPWLRAYNATQHRGLNAFRPVPPEDHAVPVPDKFLPERNDFPSMLQRRGLTGVGVEVGVLRGEFSEVMLQSWPGEWHCVDLWPDVAPDYYPEGPSFVATQARLARFGKRVHYHHRGSAEAAVTFADNSLCFCYIDADHFLDRALQDLALWWPKIRPGGILAGHDFFNEHWPEVRRAASEFAIRHGLTLYTTSQEKYSSFYFVKPGEKQ